MKKILLATSLLIQPLTSFCSESMITEAPSKSEKVKVLNAYYWTSDHKRISIYGKFVTVRYYTNKYNKVVKLDVYTQEGIKIPSSLKNICFISYKN